MSAPDLSEARTHAEAVAYGKLLAVREILDALAKEHPSAYNKPAYINGYDRAVGVEGRRSVTTTCGALARRHFRAVLDQAEVEWIEHKGWLESTFVIRGTTVELRAVGRWIEAVNEESA